MATGVETLNSNAQVMGADAALAVNISAAKGMQAVLKTNLGPKGTLKMLVGGAGQIKLTKDGTSLLREMQIQHPTAIMIARCATSQEEMCGDGTTSNVLFIGELLKQAERFLSEGMHPRVVCDGFEIAKAATLELLEEMKVEPKDGVAMEDDRALLVQLAQTALRTKMHKALADQLVEIVTDAVLCVRKPNEPINLHMVEIIHMLHRAGSETRLVKGLVMDHGARHPGMPKSLSNCYIMICNISMEYEKTEVSSGFFYKNAGEREKMVHAERKFTDNKVRSIIEFKKRVCTPENGKTFVIVNQKGIDPLSLDMLCKEGIIALRRAKRRNMERLSLACGGYQVNNDKDLELDCLGEAEKVYEQVLGETKYTFVEGTKNPFSCSILVKGPNPHTISQIKDTIHDGLRAVKNAIEDGALIPGGGAFELAAHKRLTEVVAKTQGRAKLGVQAFADAMLIVPKTLATNSGFDVQDTLISLQEEMARVDAPIGLDVSTGKPMLPVQLGIFDNYRVKRQMLALCCVLATQLLLVDEIMRAGRGSRPKHEIPR